MLCKYCGKLMYIDDVDYNFKGNKDIYYCCEHCGASCIDKIRFGRSFKVVWCPPEN